MRFADPGIQTALTGWRAQVEAKERAAADNLWFEDRVSVPRQQAFEAYAAGARAADELKRRQTDYWEEHVRVDEEIAHTFDVALSPADLAPIDEAQTIVRLENLTRPLSQMGAPMSVERLKQAVANNENALVDAFLRVWDNPACATGALASVRSRTKSATISRDPTGPRACEIGSAWLTTIVRRGRCRSR